MGKGYDKKKQQSFMDLMNAAAAAVTLVRQYHLIEDEQDYLLLSLAHATDQKEKDGYITRLTEIHLELRDIEGLIPLDSLHKLKDRSYKQKGRYAQ